jgi:hypothetical protein
LQIGGADGIIARGESAGDVRGADQSGRHES